MNPEEMKAELDKLFEAQQAKAATSVDALKKQIGVLEEQVLEIAIAQGRPHGLTGDGGSGEFGARKALEAFIRTGERLEKAMSIGSGADGGLSVPTELDRQLQVLAANMSPILQITKRVENATDAYVQLVAQGLPASAWIAETGTRAATATPQFASVSFSRGGLYAVASLTQWLAQDSTFDLTNWLISELGRAFGAAIGAALAVGDATNKPKGITTYTTVATDDATRAFGQLQYVPSGTAAAVNLDACLTAIYKLHPEYQAKAQFVMAPSAALSLRSQKASTAGSFMWDPDAKAGEPATLFGLPVYVDPNMPAVAANSLSIAVGDWQRGYSTIFYGRPILLRDDVTSKGNVQIYSERRVGGGITDSNAIKFVKAAAS